MEVRISQADLQIILHGLTKQSEVFEIDEMCLSDAHRDDEMNRYESIRIQILVLVNNISDANNRKIYEAENKEMDYHVIIGYDHEVKQGEIGLPKTELNYILSGLNQMGSMYRCLLGSSDTEHVELNAQYATKYRRALCLHNEIKKISTAITHNPSYHAWIGWYKEKRPISKETIATKIPGVNGTWKTLQSRYINVNDKLSLLNELYRQWGTLIECIEEEADFCVTTGLVNESFYKFQPYDVYKGLDVLVEGIRAVMEELQNLPTIESSAKDRKGASECSSNDLCISKYDMECLWETLNDVATDLAEHLP